MWESNQNVMDAAKIWWKSKVKTEEEVDRAIKKQNENTKNEEGTTKRKRNSVLKTEASIFLL